MRIGFKLKLKFLKHIFSSQDIGSLFQEHASRLPELCITFRRGGWKGDEIFRFSRCSFTVMRKILIEFSFFISVRVTVTFN